ncbi:MAG: tRNA (adenosine(37)-N6)-dimethylallyltransferase MiaA [Ignavibacteriaceae bacterium]
MERKVILILGPTASGKTALSLQLAELLQSPIISADSRQVYKTLDIGTAKPSQEYLSKIRHHLVDFLEPWQDYNASQFEKDALGIIRELHKQNIIPIVAGGSGLYIRALIDGIFDSVETDSAYRDHLEKIRIEMGNEFLYNQLREVDPVSAEKLLPQNYKRVIRALEVLNISGEPIWKHQTEYERKVDLDFFQYGLNWKRDLLYDNINRRVDEMMSAGFMDEVKNLLNMGYDLSYNSMNTVGYKEIIHYLDGKTGLNAAVEAFKKATRNYAKRQMTWFRKDKRIRWFEIDSYDDLSQITDSIIKDFHKNKLSE